MVDRLRAYRCWLARRMVVIGPCLAGTIAALVHFSLEPAPVAVRILCVSFTGLILAVLGYFLVESALAARHRGPASRLFRFHVRPYAEVSLALLLLLVGLLLAPELVRSSPKAPEPEEPIATRGEPTGAGSREEAVVSPTHRPVPIPGRSTPPEDREIAKLPTSLRSEPLQDEAQDTPEDLRKRENPRLEDLLPGDGLDARLIRRGLPPDGRPDLLPPTEARLGVYLLWEDAEVEGGGLALEFDFPVSKSDAVRVSILAVSTGTPEQAVEDPEAEWTHITAELVHRFAGYEATSVFDFAVGIGVSADLFRGAQDAAISPYFSIEVAVWPVDSFGLVLHASQTLPVEITGASASITDLRLFVRWDATDALSIHAGYRVVWIRTSGDEEEFQGPMVGVDIRF